MLNFYIEYMSLVEIKKIREEIAKIKFETSEKILKLRDFRDKEIDIKLKRIDYLKNILDNF